MKNPLAATPAPDFDHPLEMLAACHDRIEDRIDTLQRLVAHLAEHGCDDQAQQAAANVLRYFDTAGEHHHDDEERDLFPVLASKTLPDAAANALIDRLRADHTRMRALWQALRVPLTTLAAGVPVQLDPALAQEFGALYRNHIVVEEAELLPLAARVLSASDKAALGALMAQRRGVKS